MSGKQSLTPVWVVAEGAAGEATLEALGEAVELARPGVAGAVTVGPASSFSGRPARRLRPRRDARSERGSPTTPLTR